jgi:hypothetical protein
MQVTQVDRVERPAEDTDAAQGTLFAGSVRHRYS